MQFEKIEFELTKDLKEEIQSRADMLGETIAGYLLGLHRIDMQQFDTETVKLMKKWDDNQ